MRNTFLTITFCLMWAIQAQAQYISAQSHKQATATSQSITGDGAGTAVDITGYSSVLLTVQGTYVLVAIDFQASPDATNYFPLACARVDSSVVETGGASLTNTTRAWRCNVTGFTRFRHNSDHTSGTANLTITPVAAASDLGVTVGQATASSLKVEPAGNVASGATDSGNPVKTGAVFNTTQPTVTNGQRVDAQATARGAQIVATGTDTFNVTVNAALPTGSNTIGALTANQSVNVAQLAGTTTSVGNGASGNGVLRVTLANDSTGVVSLVPATSGGLTISRTLSAASTNATSVKGSAGQVYAIYVINTNASVRYLKLYNKASSPTVGTDTPVLTLPISGSTTGGGFVFSTDVGIAFGTGIALALTTGVADNDTGSVAANEIVVNLLYK